MSFGVIDTGFRRKALAEILAELEDGWRDIFGADVDVSPDSPDGQILGLFAGALDEAWQAAEAAYSSFRPRQAQGAALSEIVGLNGITRKIGTRSRIVATITGTPGTFVGGTKVAETVNGDQFTPLIAFTIGGGGTATGVWEAVETGQIAVGPNELTRIVTPVSGWDSIDNGANTTSSGGLNVLGTDDESDGALRARQVLSTESGAVNILESLYAALLQVEGVSRVRIYVNDTNGTVDGRPPHSYEVVVEGGDDQDVADAIWSRHPAGIELFGSSSVNVTDSQGFVHAIEFTRPVAVPIHIAITLSATAEYPSTGDDDIRQALVDLANGVLDESYELGIGDDVLVSRLYTAINSVPGHSVVSLLVDTVDPPVGAANITIDETEIASILIANVDVTS